jgi:hypothetical protein
VALTTDATGGAYSVTSAGATLKTVSLPVGVTLTSNTMVSFDAMRGLAQVTIFSGSSSGSPATLRVKVNAVGRVLLCSPSGSFAGYQTC